MTSLTPAALEYHHAGFAVIPVQLDGSKSPAVNAWRKWIEDPQSPRDIERMFREPSAIGVLGGKMSGGLEIIDFDRAGAFDAWADLVNDIAPGLLARLPVIATPKGHHVYLRSNKCGPNEKLAMTLKTAEAKSQVIIETRGHGGYVLAPPSPGAAHPSGKTYDHWAGPEILLTPIVTDDERDLLFNAARSFNETAEESHQDRADHSTLPTGQGRPGDEFAARVSWSEILRPHGWSEVRQLGKVTHWRRPGKDDKGISATTGYTGDKLYAFSSNAQPFEAQRAYGKFSAFAILNHGGDWSAAAKELKDRGFGEQSRERKPKSWPKDWKVEGEGYEQTITVPMHHDAPPPGDDDAPPDLVEPAINSEELERLLDDDIGAAMSPSVFARLLAVRSDNAEWMRIGEILRRRKIKKEFTLAVKEHDRKTKHIARTSEPTGNWRSALLFRENKSGDMVLENCLTNLVLILANDDTWRGVLAYDDFSNQIVTPKAPPFTRHSAQWSDADALEAKMWIEKNYALRPNSAAMCEAILTVAKRSSFNVVTKYLDSLEDQGRETLDTWLIDFFGAPDTPYVRAVGAKWLISAVARAYNPGVKVDTVLILEGKQGLKKSRVLEQLCPDLAWFTDGLSDFGSKAQAEEVEGKWIIELGELKGFGRELEQIKAFVTRRAENYRPAYARYSVHSKRKCVFAGTINPSNAGYLRDETGNRRFWPVACSNKAPELTPALRDQLWAEARSRFQHGEHWWLEDEALTEAATKEQAQRVYLDPWHEKIDYALIGKEDTSVDELLSECLRIEVSKWGVAESMRVGRVLTALGWVKYRKNFPNGRRSWRYRHATSYANGEQLELAS